MVEGVNSPCVDGSGLKHTLERRVFELVQPYWEGAQSGVKKPHYHQAFVQVAVDRPGLAQAAAQVSDQIILGDLMVALGIPIPVWVLPNFRRVARLMLPFVSHFPMSMLFYGSSGTEREPKYIKF